MSIRGGDGGLTPTFPPLLSFTSLGPHPSSPNGAPTPSQRKDNMPRHWNGLEETLWLRHHSKLICSMPPEPHTPTARYTIREAVIASTYSFELCMEHPRSPKHLKGHS